MQLQLARGAGTETSGSLWIYTVREAKTMSSRARMQPVGKSGQSGKLVFKPGWNIVIESPTGTGLGRVAPSFSFLGSS